MLIARKCCRVRERMDDRTRSGRDELPHTLLGRRGHTVGKGRPQRSRPDALAGGVEVRSSHLSLVQTEWIDVRLRHETGTNHPGDTRSAGRQRALLRLGRRQTAGLRSIDPVFVVRHLSLSLSPDGAKSSPQVRRIWATHLPAPIRILRRFVVSRSLSLRTRYPLVLSLQSLRRFVLPVRSPSVFQLSAPLSGLGGVALVRFGGMPGVVQVDERFDDPSSAFMFGAQRVREPIVRL